MKQKISEEFKKVERKSRKPLNYVYYENSRKEGPENI